MNSRQKPLRNTKPLMQHLQNRSHTVGRAASIRHDPALLARNILVRVHTIDESRRVRTRRRNKNPFRAGVRDMVHSEIALGEFPRALEDIVDAETGPVELLQVPLGGEGDSVAANGDEAVGDDLDVGSLVEIAHAGVVADKVDEVVDRYAGVVDGDDLDVGAD